MFLTRKGILDWSKTSLVCKKKHGLENRTMWPVAIIGLVFGMQKYFWAAKDILICKKIQFAKKHFEKAGWLWPLAIDLVSGLQPLSSCRAPRSCKTQLEFYLRIKKKQKETKDSKTPHCHCSNHVSCQNKQTSLKKGEATPKEEATMRDATSW